MKYPFCETILLLLFVMVCWIPSGVNAQTSVHSSWGEGTGQGWSLTYSVGQLFTTQVDVVPFLLKFSEGVQQPFEVIRIGGTSSDSMRVYPIPSDADITLQITGQTSRWTGYRLLDYRGRLLTTGMITGEFTSISLIPYSSSAYMLEVEGDSQPTQVFRVIKR
jgi:methionine-rich copper-binding protein CopC